MAETKPDSKKTKDSTTNKEYLARILAKLEEIATLLTKQNEMLTESSGQMAAGTSDDYNETSEDTSYGSGYSEGEEEEETGDKDEEDTRSFVDTDETGHYEENEYAKEYQAGSSEHAWRPPHWEYKRSDHRVSPDPKTRPFQDRNDQETFFEPDEDTGDEESYDPEDRYRPKTPRCPQCGMITQYSEEEDDYYCWMCEKYIKEME